MGRTRKAGITADQPPKKSKPPKKLLTDVPAELRMRLFAPGMTPLHRAGLAGLACTLRTMERDQVAGTLADDQLPGDWSAGPPWQIAADEVVLKFGSPESAGEYLRRLFAFAFQIRDGVIYMPGQYPDPPPSLAVRAALQEGLLLSLYDHGPQSRGVREVSQATVEVDDVSIPFRLVRLDWYKHQRDGAELAYASLTMPAEVSRMLFPGAIKRHNTVTASAVVMMAEQLVPLLFAPVGTFALRMGAKRVVVRGKRVAKAGATLIIPDFSDLLDGLELLPTLLPQTVTETKVGSTGDAILGAELRLRSRHLLGRAGLVAVRAVWCCATNWNSQLQPPGKVVEVEQEVFTERLLGRYERAWVNLPPRVRLAAGDGEVGGDSENGEGYWVNSVVRPFIAENLALGRSWYAGFVDLLTKVNPATNRPYRNQLPFERGGMHAMIADREMWDDDGEALIVRAVHEAIRYTLGRIKEETDGPGGRPPSQATKNRWTKFQDTLRISLAGAKTANDARHTLCDLFSRAGRVPALVEGWRAVLPKLSNHRWQLTRDLALLALASYSGRGTGGDDQQPQSE